MDVDVGVASAWTQKLDALDYSKQVTNMVRHVGDIFSLVSALKEHDPKTLIVVAHQANAAAKGVAGI